MILREFRDSCQFEELKQRYFQKLIKNIKMKDFFLRVHKIEKKEAHKEHLSSCASS